VQRGELEKVPRTDRWSQELESALRSRNLMKSLSICIARSINHFDVAMKIPQTRCNLLQSLATFLLAENLVGEFPRARLVIAFFIISLTARAFTVLNQFVPISQPDSSRLDTRSQVTLARRDKIGLSDEAHLGTQLNYLARN
jgi:hypothetical protein